MVRETVASWDKAVPLRLGSVVGNTQGTHTARQARRKGIPLTSEIEVHQCLSERGSGSREEVDTWGPNMGAVTQIQGTELGSMAQQEPQGGISELQAS